jgi:hypothetical protein
MQHSSKAKVQEKKRMVNVIDVIFDHCQGSMIFVTGTFSKEEIVLLKSRRRSVSEREFLQVETFIKIKQLESFSARTRGAFIW